MQSIQIVDSSKIFTPSLKYVDDSFTINQTTSQFDQGFTFNEAEALRNLNDQSTNNYNMLYLTTRKHVDDLFTFEQQDTDIETLVTPLIFSHQTTGADLYLKFSTNVAEIVSYEDVTDTDLLQFQIIIDSPTEMRLLHVNGSSNYYLATEDNSTLIFSASSANNTFRYLLDNDGYLLLYRAISGSIQKILTVAADNTISLEDVTAYQPIKGTANVIRVNYTFTNITYNVNNSWVSYKTNNINDFSINTEKSAFDLEGQYLLTTNYNTIGENIDINFITLKSNTSEKNYTKRGSSLNRVDNSVPSVDYRFYSAINSGNDQEKGNDNIVLTYTFYDQDIKAKPGTDTFFRTSSSLYPYERLNVNDSKLVVNGALGSKSPATSDNVYKLRTNSTGFNNGRYLCTWLSACEANTAFVWVDRYYYPDLIQKEEAYRGATVYRPSFIDSIDSVAYDATYYTDINNNKYFDKLSDLFFEPNTTYRYVRRSENDIISYVNTLSSNILYQKDNLKLNGTNSESVIVNSINDTGEFTVSFDIHLDPSKKYGYSILGNHTNVGFSVTNDTAITPFIISLSGKALLRYNTHLDIVDQSIFEKNVKDVIRFDALDDFIVVCEDGYVYSLRADNVIQRLNIIPSLSSYISYNISANQVAFVKNDSTAVCVDKSTLQTSISSINDTLGLGVSSVYYNLSGLLGSPGTSIKTYNTTHMLYQSGSTIFKLKAGEDNATPVVQSSSTLKDFAVDENGNILLLHDVDKFTLINKNRKVLFTQTLSTIPLTGSRCEFVTQYGFDRKDTFITIAGIDINGSQAIAMYDSDSVLRSYSSIQGTLTSTQSNFTGYNYFIDKNTNHNLTFRLTLANILDNTDITTTALTYDYKDIEPGFTTFTYTFDSLKGTIKLYMNSILQQETSVTPAKYSVKTIQTNNFIIGATSFYNNIKLADYIKQPGFYHIYGTTLKNVYIYDKALTFDKINALNILGNAIDPIIISIPCGQRNNIEEIIRYFKFGVPNSISNKIDIVVKNSGITDEAQQNAIKGEIINNITALLKGDAVINNINFIDYAPHPVV